MDLDAPARIDPHLAAHLLDGQAIDLGITDAGDAVAAVEAGDPYAEPVQGQRQEGQALFDERRPAVPRKAMGDLRHRDEQAHWLALEALEPETQVEWRRAVCLGVDHERVDRGLGTDCPCGGVDKARRRGPGRAGDRRCNRDPHQ